MTREETKKILAVISSLYSNFKPENKTEAVDAWNWALEEYPYEEVGKALRTFVKTNGDAFPPSVSQLIAVMNKPIEQGYVEEGEAWALVRRALSNGAYHSQEEFDKLPTLIQKALGSAGMLHTMALDPEFNESVESSNFKRQYRKLVDKDIEYQKMPIDMRLAVDQRKQLMIGANNG